MEENPKSVEISQLNNYLYPSKSLFMAALHVAANGTCTITEKLVGGPGHPLTQGLGDHKRKVDFENSNNIWNLILRKCFYVYIQTRKLN